MDREDDYEDEYAGPSAPFPSKKKLIASETSLLSTIFSESIIVPYIVEPEPEYEVVDEDNDGTGVNGIIAPNRENEEDKGYQLEEKEAENGVADQDNEDKLHKHQRFFRDQINVDRPKWPENRWWFNTMAMAAYMIDMSNLSSFPNNVSKYGGISYIIAYIIALLFFAYPALCLEVFLGQYFQTGMIGIWGVSPIGRALGSGLFYFNFITLAFLPLNILWSFMMMMDATFSLHTGNLIWDSCENDWNTCRCIGKQSLECKEKNVSSTPTLSENSPGSEYLIGKLLKLWKTKYADPTVIQDITDNGNWSIAYGFNNEKEGLGPLIPSYCFLLCGIFILLFLLNMLKLKSLGYLYTFTNSVSFIVLALLACRAASLEGAYSGLQKYFGFDLRRLFDTSMWHVAFTNALFSTSCGMGGCVVQSSFNPLHHNGHRDVIFAMTVDTLINSMSCLIAFMFVGHQHSVQNTPLPDEFPGSNFVFTTFAESLDTVSGFSFFGVMFYFMVFLITLDTQVVTLNALTYSVYEEYKRIHPKQSVSRIQFMFSVWGFALSISLICTTRGGYWVFSFVLNNALGLTYFVFVACESGICAWLWGIQSICIVTESMMGHRPGIFLRVCWKYFLPFIIPFILIYSNIVNTYTHSPIQVFGQVGPAVTVNLSYLMEFVPMILICVYSCYVFCKIGAKAKGATCLQFFMLMLSPEYEHEEIMADLRSAKRLTWSHYTFIMYDDEKEKLKECMQNAFNKSKGLMAKFRKSGDGERKKPIEISVVKEVLDVEQSTETEDTKKVKKKKKMKDLIKSKEHGNAWDLWSMIKLDDMHKMEDSGEVHPAEIDAREETIELASTSKKKHRSKASKTKLTSIEIESNDFDQKNYPKQTKGKASKKVARKTWFKTKGSKVKPRAKDLEGE